MLAFLGLRALRATTSTPTTSRCKGGARLDASRMFSGINRRLMTVGTFRTFIQQTLRGAGGARTHDRRIMRTTARRSRRSTCTDTTEPCHRWPSLHCMHGWLGPRTGPRPPQRAPDVNYGASPHTARDPPGRPSGPLDGCPRRARTDVLSRRADLQPLPRRSSEASGPAGGSLR
jgi:hypothetical protein